MRFWDASAIVPLFLEQPSTKAALALHREDPEMAVWWGTTIECASAVARLHRDGVLTTRADRDARGLLAALQQSWFEVQPGDAVRDQAMRLLRLHVLRAADALQLSAAIEWAGSPSTGMLVTYSDRLRTAAQREGFDTN